MQTLDPPLKNRNVAVVRMPEIRKLRTAWISDVHLGTRSSNASALLEFLRNHDFETLYIVGDLIDVWQMRAGIFWPPQNKAIRLKSDSSHSWA